LSNDVCFGMSVEATHDVVASRALQVDGVLYVGGTNGDDKIHFTPATGGLILLAFDDTLFIERPRNVRKSNSLTVTSR
jgi:hypothetical protein